MLTFLFPYSMLLNGMSLPPQSDVSRLFAKILHALFYTQIYICPTCECKVEVEEMQWETLIWKSLLLCLLLTE